MEQESFVALHTCFTRKTHSPPVAASTVMAVDQCCQNPIN